MNVRKIVLGLSLFCLVSSGVRAQDDMYFVPKKVDKTEVAEERSVVRAIPMRDVDEYNRRGQFSSQYQSVDLDTLYSDVIIMDTASVDTTTENALAVDDFDYAYDPQDDYTYSRRLSRYDDYYWHDPWYYGWYGYGPYWYGSPYWYAGLWYAPWFYGWHRPWGWYYPSYWYGSYYRPYRGVTGTMNHGRIYGHNSGTANNFKGYRGTTNSSRVNYNQNTINRNDKNNSTNRFKGNRVNRDNNQLNNNRQNYQSRPSYNNNNFGGNRSGGSFRGGGSFGGSRSGGSGGGGFRGRR